MPRCETIKIATDEGFKIINLDDFDPEVDEQFNELDDDSIRFNKIIVDLNNSNADDLKFASGELGFDYSNKEEAIKNISSFLELEAKKAD